MCPHLLLLCWNKNGTTFVAVHCTSVLDSKWLDNFFWKKDGEDQFSRLSGDGLGRPLSPCLPCRCSVTPAAVSLTSVCRWGSSWCWNRPGTISWSSATRWVSAHKHVLNIPLMICSSSWQNCVVLPGWSRTGGPGGGWGPSTDRRPRPVSRSGRGTTTYSQWTPTDSLMNT